MSLLSQQTGHKYTFQLQLKKLFITPSLPFQIKIIWARGQNRIQSQNAIKLIPPQNEITLQQCFCNKSTVLFNPKKLQFRKKQSRIQIILYANGSPKQGGQFVLNLCEILDPYNIKKQQQKVYRVVTRQQKPRCEIEFKLTAQYCQQMIRDQQRSIGSGVGSISSKNTTSMGYGMNNNNNNINYDPSKQYIQKKNLFLYEAPSKDNQSVVSYNSYSTGMMRYQSGNKKERQDSMHKEEYGLATTTRLTGGGGSNINNINSNANTNDMFTKTTSNMKSALSNNNNNTQFDNKSRNAYNRVTQNNNTPLSQQYNNQNFDNRTQNFDNPSSSNKQLQQQQTKRSKLQTQVTRLNIYMKQQSSKLTEYIQENTKLKEQLSRMSAQHTKTKQNSTQPLIEMEKQTLLLKQQYHQQLQKLNKQNQELHNRGFQVTNQNRQLKARLQQFYKQRQQIQQQLRQYKIQKQRAQSKFQSLNRNIQGIMSNRQSSNKQLQNIKDQLQHTKSLNNNLRDTLEKQRRKINELQMNTNYQKSSIQENLKIKQQHLYQLQRQNSVLMTQLRDRENQIQTKKQLLYRQQKTSNQYKQKILISDRDKSKFLLQNASLKNQNDKLKIQVGNTNALSETMRKELQNKKNQIYRLQANLKGLKQIQNKFYYLDKIQNQKQREIINLRQQNNKYTVRINQVQDQCRKLAGQNQELKKKQLSVPDVDVNQILRESVQMQVELKFKTDELLRLKSIQQKYNEVLYRLEMQEKNRKQVQQDVQKLQRQVKQKNKLYLIEVEKGKMTTRQKSQLQKQFQDIRNQLKRCQQIIFNGDKQVKQMQVHINYLQTENNQLGTKLTSSQKQLSLVLTKLNDSSRLQARLKQIAEQAESASQKLIKMEDTHSTVSNQLIKAVNQKKSLQLKCQTIMRELHSLKKQYEDQKVRSTSVVSIRSNEDQVKIRQLQHQIDKKDKTISKLTKEKLQIQEQNINLHVQVMKKLSEMQKNKDLTPHGNENQK